jgi:hypothetical protein
MPNIPRIRDTFWRLFTEWPKYVSYHTVCHLSPNRSVITQYVSYHHNMSVIITICQLSQQYVSYCHNMSVITIICQLSPQYVSYHPICQLLPQYVSYHPICQLSPNMSVITTIWQLSPNRSVTTQYVRYHHNMSVITTMCQLSSQYVSYRHNMSVITQFVSYHPIHIFKTQFIDIKYEFSKHLGYSLRICANYRKSSNNTSLFPLRSCARLAKIS